MRYVIMQGTGERKTFAEIKKGEIFLLFSADDKKIMPRFGNCDFWVATSSPWEKKDGSTSIYAQGYWK